MTCGSQVCPVRWRVKSITEPLWFWHTNAPFDLSKRSVTLTLHCLDQRGRGTNMRVKVHPHKTRVNSGVEACVSVTPDSQGGRAYYMGTVALSDVRFRIHNSGLIRAQAEQVRNVHAWAVGTLDFEHPEQGQVGESLLSTLAQVTYHFNVGRFMTVGPNPVDVTDRTFATAVVSGRDFFVSV